MSGVVARVAAGLLCALGLASASHGARADGLIEAPNIEDLATTADGRWVIATSMVGGAQTRGALYLIDARTRSAKRFEPADAPGTALCPGGFQASRFAPHGMVLEGARGAERLHVINHGPEAVERFRVTVDGGEPRIEWEDCLPLPKGAFGNAVTVHGGEIIVSNIAQALGEPAGVKGDLLRWTAKTGWQALTGTQAMSWNGVAHSADGKRLYAASYRGRRIYEFTLGSAEPPRSVVASFLPDNLRWAKDGALLAAGQDAEPQAVVDCHFSTRESCGIDWAFGSLDPATLQWTCVSRRKATPAFGSATTALPVGSELWLGTTRGGAIMITAPCAG